MKSLWKSIVFLVLVISASSSLLLYPTEANGTRHGHIKIIELRNEPEINLGEPGDVPLGRSGTQTYGSSVCRPVNDEYSNKCEKTGNMRWYAFFRLFFNLFYWSF